MNTSFGKYRAYNTIIHKIDPRIKLVSLIIFMVSMFLSYSTNPFMNLTIYAMIFIIAFIIGIISKVSFLSIFRSLMALWIMIIFIAVLNIFLLKPSQGQELGIAFSINGFPIYWQGIINMLYIIARLVVIIMLTNIFTSTTKPMEMTNALEWLLFPLSLIKIPVHKFAMAISLALRFIPTLQEETARIMKAQASRGVDFQNGKFKEKIRSLISLIIPLFISSFTISGQLADAMEARCYDPNAKRTKYKTTFWGWKDTFALLFALCLLTCIILLMVFHPDIYAILHINVPKV